MKFIKYIKRFNLFQPQKAKKLSEIKINVNETVVALNEDNTLYGVCGVVETPPHWIQQQQKIPCFKKELEYK